MLTRENLLRILADQKKTFLTKEIGIQRELLSMIPKYSKIPHVIIITGLRRCGKSTLLRQIVSQIYSNENFYYINFEDERLFNFPASEFNLMYECLIELYGKCQTFFIDEIQNIPEFERFIRRFMDEGFKFYISGSNSALLSDELGTKLTGRHIDLVLKPFSFTEFLSFKKITYSLNETYITEHRAELYRLFDEYLIYGGMPEYLKFNLGEIYQQVYEDIVIKDIVMRFKIENVVELRELYMNLISNVCQKFSYNNLASITAIKSPNTVKNYIGYLEKSYLGIIIPKFDFSPRKQIIYDKKFYLIDNGFITFLSRKITSDKGWYLENLVIASLYKKEKIFYFQNKGECDILVINEKNPEMAIQVCYDLNKNNRDRELNGLLECLNRMKLTEGYIITYDIHEELDLEGKKIHIYPAWLWFLQELSYI